MYRKGARPVSWRLTEALMEMPDSSPTPASLYDLLHDRAARIPVTQSLIGANVLVFVAMLFAGAGLWHSNNGVQLAWGANFGPATQDGQWWRLGSALFLHFGLLHIVMNMWALWDGGQLVERIYGRLRFTLIYFGSGLCGNLLSLVMQGNRAVSGGASGAIFGIYGALLIYLWRERKHLQPREFRWLFWAGCAFAGSCIALGLFVPGIDNSAHIGGLVAGILLGLMLGEPLFAKEAWPMRERRIAGLGLAGMIIVLVTHIPTPSYRWRAELAARQEIQEFFDRETQIQANWRDILRRDRQGAESFEQLAERIETEITEQYEESFEQLSQLSLDPASPSAARVQSLRLYSEKRRDSSQALANELRAKARFGPSRPNRPEPKLTAPEKP